MKNKVYAAMLAASTLWCLSIAAAPLAGLSGVYTFFSTVCHQDPARSWHLMGEALPVCIRCASIYFGFAASLWLGLAPRTRWLQVSAGLLILEFAVARLFIDAAALRSITGILAGAAAAPFVRLGVEEMAGTKSLQGEIRESM